MADIRDTLALGDFYHIGVAVNDIDRGIERLTALGMTAGPMFELLVPSLYRGKKTEAGVKAVFAPLDGIAIELAEPTGGESSIATFLREHGEGVQHFGYRVDDLKATIECAEALNIEFEWLVSDEHGPAVAFLSPDAFFGEMSSL
jgi:catechol 2,3-dioxygenase-like lactoylglutathione lyase family enzyme